MVISIDLDWLQHLMKVLIGIFWKYGLAADVAKSGTMICRPSDFRSGMSEQARELKGKGLGDSYHERLYQQIPRPECRVKITAGLMTSHPFRMHSMEPAIDWDHMTVSQKEHHP